MKIGKSADLEFLRFWMQVQCSSEQPSGEDNPMTSYGSHNLQEYQGPICNNRKENLQHLQNKRNVLFEQRHKNE